MLKQKEKNAIGAGNILIHLHIIKIKSFGMVNTLSIMIMGLFIYKGTIYLERKTEIGQNTIQIELLGMKVFFLKIKNLVNGIIIMKKEI